jgi:hypothetical protein
MNIIQTVLHSVEAGKAQVLSRLIPFVLMLAVVLLVYDFDVYRGLNDPQSMDNAQLARQISSAHGFTTKFIRPAALAQLGALGLAKNGKAVDLFPAAQFPSGTQRYLPDTYNAPAYPYLLAGWFDLLHPAFKEPLTALLAKHMYAGDRPIPWLNQIFLVLTSLLVFFWGRRLFDSRVAWMSLLSFLLTDIVWQYSITALSTSLLMFLVTAVLFIAVEIFEVGEVSFKHQDASFGAAWIWTLALGVLLGLACLARLHLLILLVPVGIFLIFVPRTNYGLIPLLAVIVLGMTVPWLWHISNLSGNPLGSNVSLLHYGVPGFDGNQIYCVLQPPSYEQLFVDLGKKEILGWGWHFGHAWEMLGCNPMVLLFVASILHNFRRSRIRAFRWLIIGCAVVIVVVNSLGVPQPEAVGPWNALVVLLPSMVVVGSAFFFILLDRLSLPLRLVNTAIPMGITFSKMGGQYNYPPYSPPAINAIGQFVRPDDWVTTDMPWAMAWYGDHTSVWLPDTISDFEDIHDNTNPSGLLLITPVLLGKPATTLTSGEYKEWFPFVTGVNLPPNFPLVGRVAMKSGGVEYLLWASRGGG